MSKPAWWNRVVDEIDTYQLTNPANLPGAVFAVETQQDGRLIDSVGEQWANNTICSIGSMGKAFIGTAVLLALEEYDRLDVETLICDLPGMDICGDNPLKRQIRVKHLLQQTSGLLSARRYTENPKTPCNDPLGKAPCCSDDRFNLGPTAPWIGGPGITNECIFADGRCQPARQLSLDKVSSYILQTYPLAHQPGAQYTYSTANYVVAASIVEALSGQSINLYLKEKLFTPLGMTDSFFIAQETGDPLVDARMSEGVTAEQRARIADMAVITQDGQMPEEIAPAADGRWDKFRRGWRYVFPDAGMYSTADDLLTYLGMLRDRGMSRGRSILSPTIVSLLVDDQGYGHTMGFGYRSRPTPYGQGAGTLEHMGNAMTYFWYDPVPDNPLIGVFLSQRLTNVAVNNNMGAGMKVIFRVFVPLVKGGIFGSLSAEQPSLVH
jgi:CubicO group peptidase (beta-lactamase class C family)